MLRMEPGAWPRKMSIAFRSFASASSVTCARTCATSSASTICTIVLRGLASWSTQPHLEMHPLDIENRTGDLRRDQGIGYCNITKCCTKVCPEGITITDNAIIPLKERVVDEYFDPLQKALSRF